MKDLNNKKYIRYNRELEFLTTKLKFLLLKLDLPKNH